MEEAQDDPAAPEDDEQNDEGTAPPEETPAPAPAEDANNEVANIAAKFLNRQKCWQERVDTAAKRPNTCTPPPPPPPRRTQPVRATKTGPTVQKGVAKTRANPAPAPECR